MSDKPIHYRVSGDLAALTIDKGVCCCGGGDANGAAEGAGGC